MAYNSSGPETSWACHQSKLHCRHGTDLMAPLKNPRHERFVQLLMQGESQTDAFEYAGFKRDDGNAARLAQNPRVRERLTELQNQTAADNRITIESICRELDDACNVARVKGQAAAMVSASALRAKLAGLGVERQQIEVGGPGEFDGLNSTEDICDKLASEFLGGVNHGVTKEDHAQLAALFAESFERVTALIDAIKARPPTKLAITPPTRRNGKGAGA
jgi:hypothetical protein